MGNLNRIHFRPEDCLYMACGLDGRKYPMSRQLDDITCGHCRNAAVKAGHSKTLARIATALGLPAGASVEECEREAQGLVFKTQHVNCKHVWSQHEIDESHQRAELLSRQVIEFDEDAAARLAALSRVAEAARTVEQNSHRLALNDGLVIVNAEHIAALRTALSGVTGTKGEEP